MKHLIAATAALSFFIALPAWGLGNCPDGTPILQGRGCPCPDDVHYTGDPGGCPKPAATSQPKWGGAAPAVGRAIDASGGRLQEKKATPTAGRTEVLECPATMNLTMDLRKAVVAGVPASFQNVDVWTLNNGSRSVVWTFAGSERLSYGGLWECQYNGPLGTYVLTMSTPLPPGKTCVPNTARKMECK